MGLLVVVCAAIVVTTSEASAEDAQPTTKPADIAKPAATPPVTPAPPRDPETLEDTATEHVSSEIAVYNDSDHVTVFTPSIAGAVENVNGASLRGSYLVDAVSAASVDIVSTASRKWHEVRQAGTLSGEYKPRDFGVGVGGSVSNEPDYLSYGAYARITKDFDEKNWTLFFGYGMSHDTIGRCGGANDGCTPFSVFSRELLRASFNGGVDLVLDQASTASIDLDAVVESGDQSKPYRYIPLFAPDVAPRVQKGASIDWVNANRTYEKPLEQLPLSRDRFAVTGHYARRIGSSTLRVLERGYYDTWGLLASSSDARWILDLGRRFAVWPHARFHLQRQVTFWRLAYVSGAGWNLPQFRTGDRELGPLWTAQGGLGIKWYLGRAAEPQTWAIQVSGDATYTAFLDDLYVSHRTSVLGALGFEGTF